ncbi:MAG: hypothetical protein JNM80_01250 [Phycisphaerae bacterium]|nr:hypothetical protein [Phycisphaerae bacterium]
MIARCAGSAVVLALAAQASAQWWWPPTGGLSVQPECRDPSSTITLGIGGLWPDNCVPNGVSVSRSGLEVDIVTVREPPPGGCLTVISNWSLSPMVTGLPAGTYSVFVTHQVSGQTIHPRTQVGTFQVVASCGGCYANCDGSMTPPVLNVMDFVCFLNRFAAGESYANCDGSTTPPALNISDFVCFLNAFAAGCS